MSGSTERTTAVGSSSGAHRRAVSTPTTITSSQSAGCSRSTAGAAASHALRVTTRDVGSTAFPYAHVAGPDHTVLPLRYGIPAVLFEHFALPGALAAHRRHGVTVAGGSTAFCPLFRTEQRRQASAGPLLPALRLSAGGGAPEPPGLYYEVVRELGCAPSRVRAHRGPDGHHGRPAGQRRAPGRSRRPATGRHGDPHRDRRTAEGRLVVTGRLKDIIIRKGENISAQEIENLLHRHPDLLGSAVVGLPDTARGELVCAVVERRDGAGPVTRESLGAWLRERGPVPHELPDRVEVVDALPRGATLRKVLKGELRARSALGAAGRRAPSYAGGAASQGR